MTWKDILRLTLQDLRVISAIAVPSAPDEQLALDRVNLWLDDLKTQGLSVFQTTRTLWNLSGAASYAIGTGATINVERPLKSDRIGGFAYLNNNLTPAVEVPVGIPLTDSQYNGIAYKSYSSPYPSGFFYEPTYPNGTVYPWPVPTTGNLQGVIYSDVPVSEITNRNATISLPPGYRLWILRALKVELRSAFRVAVSEQELERWIQERDLSAAHVKQVNEELMDLSFGDAGAIFGGAQVGPRNIYTGD